MNEMKTKILSLTALFVMGAVSVFAENKTEKIEAKGNCGMCETRIEKAAKSVEGVSKADWNKETKQLEVVFDDTKTDVHKVEMVIAKAGQDTEMHKAKDADYDKLLGCCKYDRSEMKMEHSNEGH